MYFQLEERPATTWAPVMDVCERPGEIVILVELPGIDKADIQISWHEGTLTVSGQKRRQPSGGGSAQYLCLERHYGPFQRRVQIHVPVDHASGHARLDDGLLRIHLPKAASRPQEVPIPIL